MSDSSDEIFLSIDDDELAQDSEQSFEQHIPLDHVIEEAILEAEVLETPVLQQATGSYGVSWPLIGMDCPDCAAKAMGALNQLAQVNNPHISATSGEVKFTVDLSRGGLAEVSNVLRSLGHAPDVEHHELVGVRAPAIAHRNAVHESRLVKMFRQQPGVLDAEISDEGRIILQLVMDAPQDLRLLRDSSIETIIGSPPRYAVTSSTKLRPDQWRLLGAAIALPLLVLVMLSEWLGWSSTLIGMIAAPGILIGGLQMFKEAFASVLNRQLGFQILTSLAVIGASVLGMWEEALIVTILVAFTAHLEGDALLKARQAMQGGLDRLPRTARRLTRSNAVCLDPSTPVTPRTITLQMAQPSMLAAPHSNMAQPETELIPIDALNVGDLIEIRSGELIPADATILEGQGSLDKAPLTGESVPVDVQQGHFIEAGLVLARGPVVAKVEAVGEATRLSGLIDAVHTFKEAPPRLQSGIEKFTAIWVPLVLFGAIAVWFFLPERDWKIILLLWVVSCPCALLLATPVPHAAALSHAAQKGVIVRGGDVMERMARVNHLLLDKTGTLTSGKPKIGTITFGKGRRKATTLSLIAGIEARSNHPYALAIAEYANQENITPAIISDLSDIDGGVQGNFEGKHVQFLRPDTAADAGIEVDSTLVSAFEAAQHEGHGASLFVVNGKGAALVSFIHDDTRDGAGELIHQMLKRQINVEVISGDHQAGVSAFASSIGLPEAAAHGGLSPEDKVRWVTGRSTNYVTMMVGDGFNDAAALAIADVGVAVGTGESVNLEAADILIPGENPNVLTTMVDLSRKAQRTLNQNLFFSVLVTIALVFAVIQEWYDQLWVGVLIHEASVIFVILNGARLSQQGQFLALLRDTFNSLINETKFAITTFLKRFSAKKTGN